jgi:hypothetical protein
MHQRDLSVYPRILATPIFLSTFEKKRDIRGNRNYPNKSEHGFFRPKVYLTWRIPLPPRPTSHTSLPTCFGLTGTFYDDNPMLNAIESATGKNDIPVVFRFSAQCPESPLAPLYMIDKTEQIKYSAHMHTKTYKLTPKFAETRIIDRGELRKREAILCQ